MTPRRALATADGLSLPSMWAVQRDNGSYQGGDGRGRLSIEQGEWAVTAILGAFTCR